MEKYWDKGMSFELYLETIQSKVDSQENHKFADKQLISIKRANRIMENYIPDVKQQKILEEKNFNGKVLIIAEDWCGDCSQSVPVIKKFFNENNNQVKVLYRDENPDLIKLFLTDGNESIPIVIFLDEKNNVINHWGPRTAFGKELLLKYKKDPENYPKELFLSDLQSYYTTNNGFDIIEEAISLL
jgi:thiol-disulfide isomerase/thioredoxin